MQALHLALMLCATPAPELKLAAPAFNVVDVKIEVANYALEHLAEQLGQRGIRIITPREITALLGMERQRQLTGCSDESNSCMAELGDALGANGIVLGDLARLGDTVELTLKVVSSPGNRRLAGFTDRVKRESELFEVLDRAAESIADQLRPKSPQVPGAGLHLRRFTWIPAAVGAVALAGAGGSYVAASRAHATLIDDKSPVVSNGPGDQVPLSAW